MALSESGMSGLMQTELKGALSVKDDAQLKKVCDAISKAVIDHFKASAVVTGSCATPSGSGTIDGKVE